MEESFIKDHFKIRYCYKYSGNSIACKCGKTLESHEIISEKGEAWSMENNTKLKSSDTYGTVHFPKSTSASPFIRFSYEDEKIVFLMYQLLVKHWEYRQPMILISMTGGFKAMDSKTNQHKKNFKLELMEVMKRGSTWLFGGGFNFGIHKFISDVVKEYRLFNDTLKDDVKLIGICTWGIVENNKELLSTDDGKNNYTYPNSTSMECKRVTLDDYYDFFIFCDDGNENRYGKEVEFRLNFEKYMQNRGTYTVQILYEGGKKTIENLYLTLEKGIPLVVIKGSGRAADIICDVLDFQQSTCQSDIKNILEKNKDNLKIKTEEMEKFQKYLYDLYGRYRKYIFIHDFNTTQLDKKISEAIISRQNTNDLDTILSILITFNYYDAADAMVFEKKEFSEIPKNILNRYFLKISKNNQTEFVEKFLENNFHISECLRETIFKDLYETLKFVKNLYAAFKIINNPSVSLMETIERFGSVTDEYLKIPGIRTALDKYLKKSGNRTLTTSYPKNPGNPTNEYYELEGLWPELDECHTIREIWTVLDEFLKIPGTRTLIGEYFEFPRSPFAMDEHCEFEGYLSEMDEYYELEEPVTRYPWASRDLFLSAVFEGHTNLAEIFWRIGEDYVGSALVGTIILKEMKIFYLKKGLIDKGNMVGKSAEKFEKFAIYLVEEANKRNQSKAFTILRRKLTQWYNMSCLQIAKSGNLLDFLITDVCRIYTAEAWKGKLSLSKNENNDDNGDVLNKPERKILSNKISSKPTKSYWKAPKFKFIVHGVFYFWFLSVFAYLNLVELKYLNSFSDMRYNFAEIYVYFNIIGLFVEEVRQVFRQKIAGIKRRIQTYIYGWWNIFDIFLMIVSVASVIIRLSIFKDYFFWVRCLYGILFIMLCIRAMQFYLGNPVIGPKVFMIRYMIVDIYFFLSIFIFFLTSYGIFAQSLQKPNAKLNLELVKNVYYQPYFQTFGDLMLDNVVVDKVCNTTSCILRNTSTIVGFGVFLIFTQVLLMNLLIAMFGDTFKNIQKKSTKIFNLIQIQLLEEFQDKPWLPPPLNILYFIIQLIKCFGKKTTKTTKRRNNLFIQDLLPEEETKIKIYEKMIFESSKIAIQFPKKGMSPPAESCLKEKRLS